jgi:hypothetical protein
MFDERKFSPLLSTGRYLFIPGLNFYVPIKQHIPIENTAFPVCCMAAPLLDVWTCGVYV